MEKVKTLMLKHPLIAKVLILPFSLVFVFTLMDLIINFILPLLFALLLSVWIYGVFVGTPVSRTIYDPFWFVKSDKL